jgi:hypothetical protein
MDKLLVANPNIQEQKSQPELKKIKFKGQSE